LLQYDDNISFKQQDVTLAHNYPHEDFLTDKKFIKKSLSKSLRPPTIIEAPQKRGTRKSVALNADEPDYLDLNQRNSNFASAQIQWNSKNRQNFIPKKFSYSKPLESGLYFLRSLDFIGWIWMLFIFFAIRFLFMERGYIDYGNRQNLILQRQNELALIQAENQSIINEMERIKKDASYQKKLAREHLGVIAEDEFLIIFSQ
jgi:cell division protein FtsB